MFKVACVAVLSFCLASLLIGNDAPLMIWGVIWGAGFLILDRKR